MHCKVKHTTLVLGDVASSRSPHSSSRCLVPHRGTAEILQIFCLVPQIGRPMENSNMFKQQDVKNYDLFSLIGPSSTNTNRFGCQNTWTWSGWASQNALVQTTKCQPAISNQKQYDFQVCHSVERNPFFYTCLTQVMAKPFFRTRVMARQPFPPFGLVISFKIRTWETNGTVTQTSMNTHMDI